jgi:hypothetical protein
MRSSRELSALVVQARTERPRVCDSIESTNAASEIKVNNVEREWDYPHRAQRCPVLRQRRPASTGTTCNFGDLGDAGAAEPHCGFAGIATLRTVLNSSSGGLRRVHVTRIANDRRVLLVVYPKVMYGHKEGDRMKRES